MSGNHLDHLDVFYGELTPARATVYARLEGLENTAKLTLGGFVRGPRCIYSKTLPATFRLQDAGPGPSLLAKSLIPDPSYWSPDTPHIYDVSVELRNGDDILASEVRQIGFKPLGISGRFFTWEGKPWVLRGVGSHHFTQNLDVLNWREQSAVIVGNALGNELLSKASEYGVICCSLINDQLSACSEFRRLAKYPSVALTALFRQYKGIAAAEAPNLICSEAIVPRMQYCRLPGPRINYVLFDSDADENAMKALESPALIDRSISTPKSFIEARAACDKLQADLAPIGQFAGYIV